MATVRPWGLWVAVALGLVGYGAMVALDASFGTLRAEQTSSTIVAYLIAFVGFVVAVVWNERRPIPAVWFWALPILFRLLLLFTEPTLSDDVYRYLWDGHLVTQGVNPYSYAISAAEVDRYEIVARTLANNRDLSSPYLPAAQFLFAAVALLAPSHPAAMQVVMTAFDLGAAVLLFRLLPLAGIPSRRVLLYLWNPLVIVEMAHGAHIDGFMVFLAVLALWAALRPDARTRVASPISLALATLTRPIPALFAPALWWRWTWRQRILYGGLLVGLVVPFGFGPSGWGLAPEPSGAGVFGSARVYSQEFRFNALPSAWLERTLGDSPSNLSAALVAIMAAVGLVVWLRARSATGADVDNVRRTVRLIAILVIAYTLLTPVLHPWYLVLLIALLPFGSPAAGESAVRWLDVAPWLYLSAAVSLSYLTYRNPDAFAELDWWRRVEWFPTLALLAVAAMTRLGPLNRSVRPTSGETIENAEVAT